MTILYLYYANLPALKLYQRVLSQGRNDKDKIYSLHEPAVKCY